MTDRPSERLKPFQHGRASVRHGAGPEAARAVGRAFARACLINDNYFAAHCLA